MADWSKMLPLTTRCRHHCQGQIPAGAREQFDTDIGLVGGFRRVLWFPPPLTTS